MRTVYYGLNGTCINLNNNEIEKINQLYLYYQKKFNLPIIDSRIIDNGFKEYCQLYSDENMVLALLQFIMEVSNIIKDTEFYFQDEGPKLYIPFLIKNGSVCPDLKLIKKWLENSEWFDFLNFTKNNQSNRRKYFNRIMKLTHQFCDASQFIRPSSNFITNELYKKKKEILSLQKNIKNEDGKLRKYLRASIMQFEKDVMNDIKIQYKNIDHYPTTIGNLNG